MSESRSNGNLASRTISKMRLRHVNLLDEACRCGRRVQLQIEGRVGPEPAACLFIMSVQPRRLTGLIVTTSAAIAWELQRFINCIKAESDAESIKANYYYFEYSPPKIESISSLLLNNRNKMLGSVHTGLQASLFYCTGHRGTGP